eukprot:TRINITY_DN74795_c0_g1_i1.p1 TRINITY_DN74795_c0_g1~~TRINITY_DN74795_c0_g1_i1.p1  ORF type:complete len:648 (-),score=74.86 TRINITY_DN74795_c0_g1_i1:225-2123(-)
MATCDRCGANTVLFPGLRGCGVCAAFHALCCLPQRGDTRAEAALNSQDPADLAPCGTTIELDQPSDPPLAEAFLESHSGPFGPEQLRTFAIDGCFLMRLPESEVPAKMHEAIYRRADELLPEELGNNIFPELAELENVLQAPSLVAALEAILGQGYRLSAHRWLHTPNMNQPWHKDSYFGRRRMRSHRPRWVMALYYPQDTVLDMGATALLPRSQYLTVDHEHRRSREDLLSPNGFVPTSDDDNEEFAMRLDPTLKQRFLTVKAGSVAIMHYDLVHRGSMSKRTDDLPTRYMFKFQFYRVREPLPRSLPVLRVPDSDPLCIAQEEALRWLGSQTPLGELVPGAEELRRLEEDLRSYSEARRISAAYRLGCAAHHVGVGHTRDEIISWLAEAMSEEHESPRRAASFGFVAAGTTAESKLLAILKSESRAPKVARRYVLWALGEIDTTSLEAAQALLSAAACSDVHDCLRNEQYEARLARATATSALGLLVQRAHRVGNVELFCSICKQLLAIVVPGGTHEWVREEAALSLLMACEVAPEWVFDFDQNQSTEFEEHSYKSILSSLIQLLSDKDRYVISYAAEALLSLADSDCNSAVQASHALRTALSAENESGEDLWGIVRRRRCPHTSSLSGF